MDYSIVVVTWQCADALGELTASMNRRLASRPRLIVVDNASDDEPEAAARRWRGPTDFHRLPANAGFGVANNVGVRRAETDAVVLLNPDTELLDRGLADLAADALRRRALVGPRVLGPDGTPEPSAHGPPTGAWPWVRALLPGAMQPVALRAHTEPWRLERPVRVAWLVGACMAGPRETLLSLGPFDESIHLYAEDLDLGLRAAAAGVSSWFLPVTARVLHHGGTSAARRFDDDIQIRVAKATALRAAMRRGAGSRAEALGWRATRTGLALRVAAKRALGRDAERDRRDLAAARAAR